MAESLYNRFRSTVASSYTAGSGTLVAADSFAGKSPTFTVGVYDQSTRALKSLLTVSSVSTVTLTVAAEDGIDANCAVGDIIAIVQSKRSVAAAAGALVLLEEHSASSSASLDFKTRNAPGQSGATIQSDFDQYLIEVISLIPESNSILEIRCSTDGGSSYDSGSNYSWNYDYTDTSGSGAIRSSSDTSIKTRDINSTLGTGGSYNASFRLFNPGSTSLYKLFLGQVSIQGDNNQIITVTGGGIYKSTTAVNALQFLMASGNIASGTIRIYGFAK